MTNSTNEEKNPEINTETTVKEQILEDKKQQLLVQKEVQENEIFDKIAGIKAEAIHKLKIVASIGSVAFGAYLVLKYFFGNKNFTLSELMPSGLLDDENDLQTEGKATGKSKEKSAENFGLNATHTHSHADENSILATFKREISLFLVAIAKQKILELLAHLQETNTEETDFEEEDTK